MANQDPDRRAPARDFTEDNWRNVMEQIRRSDQLQKEHRRAYRETMCCGPECHGNAKAQHIGDEALTKALTTARLLDQSAMAMLERYEALEEIAKANRAADRVEHPAGLRLRWGNKENIWFWHHRPPVLPLGHNCSNPGLHLSA
jgi:hypothetical protein